MEPVIAREQVIQTVVYEWAQTAGERRALGQWTIVEADALEALNEPV